MVGLYKRLWINAWRKILSSRVLTLDGWVAFDLPRSVTVLGEALLLGLAGVHVYILMTASALPGPFVLYALALAVGCLIAAVTMVTTIGSVVPQRGWYLGSLICLGFLGVYLCSRIIRLSGLESLTGRWDVAPGTLAMALAAGFIALHTTVLSGINVAYPNRQGWQD
ncbi:oxidoreductase [Mycobacterium paragordonae]|uniref:Oxidoreductase n=1 Tax=Mycobacterium paragordonae TaxID=1389713 RepID=A0A4R5WZ95_9MYCO|nr:oxidoreductase [Mycobacterium paragordonae]OBJ77295.1 oxidoreductase [Mycobacterium gordonae]MDP7737670.1 oxidoreductase [Mycobacterium paragordonae]OBK52858.1 oxidoreductase [Mycobacterium gordonae]TDK98358.1 oxidoreductase [Mycobacterium paragordonae]TDL02386.1 oxidoreductase [Mycobacterium paragordonae]